MWKKHGIEDILRGLFTGQLDQLNQPNQPEMLYIYGYPAYTLSYGILAPFRGQITPHENAMNVEMSSARIVVEWAFGLVAAEVAAAEVVGVVVGVVDAVINFTEVTVSFINLINSPMLSSTGQGA